MTLEAEHLQIVPYPPFHSTEHVFSFDQAATTVSTAVFVELHQSRLRVPHDELENGMVYYLSFTTWFLQVFVLREGDHTARVRMRAYPKPQTSDTGHRTAGPLPPEAECVTEVSTVMNAIRTAVAEFVSHINMPLEQCGVIIRRNPRKPLS